MSKTVNTHWPDEVRLKMIEKSEFYSEPQIYQYGFYDGFQHAKSQTQELQEQNAEIVANIQLLIQSLDYDALGVMSELIIEDLKELLTKHNQLNKKQ